MRTIVSSNNHSLLFVYHLLLCSINVSGPLHIIIGSKLLDYLLLRAVSRVDQLTHCATLVICLESGDHTFVHWLDDCCTVWGEKHHFYVVCPIFYGSWMAWGIVNQQEETVGNVVFGSIIKQCKGQIISSIMWVPVIQTLFLDL